MKPWKVLIAKDAMSTHFDVEVVRASINSVLNDREDVWPRGPNGETAVQLLSLDLETDAVAKDLVASGLLRTDEILLSNIS